MGYTNVTTKEARTCGSYLGSDDGLTDGWWERELVVCNANATILYTMKSGMEHYLCDHHASRYPSLKQYITKNETRV